jgi:hypothetical protein
MNANEFLFRALRLPINVLLNSINEAIDPYRLPNESVESVPINEELCEKVLKIRKSDSYKSFIEKK